MKLITIIEHFNTAEKSLDWYDNDTAELVRSYPEYVTQAELPIVQRDMLAVKNIKVPDCLTDSNLWC